MRSITLLVAALSPVLAELDINTSSGSIHGIYNNTAQTVRAFLGIPYAEAPVGKNRFLPPITKEPWQDVLDASSFPPTCPGQYTFSNESIWSVLPYLPWNTGSMSEDCLSINIWTPGKKHTGKSGKAAVMLFVYGGAFTQGGTATTFYDGCHLVQDQEDIVVVTFNYCISAFGFPNSPDIPKDKQNVGLLDQRMAVEWVHKNIANFGGDPSRIMLFGQSAGAASTDIYSYAYPDDPIINAIGMGSGVASLITSNDTTHKNWNALSKSLGCETGKGSLECVQDRSSSGRFKTISLYFDYNAQAKKGAAKLPTLMGGNIREAAAYFNLSMPSINETAEYIPTQQTFNCPIHQAALLRLEQNIPTWRYLYHGNWTNLSPVSWLGAYHSSEVPIVFGTYNITTAGIPSSAQEVQAARYIQDAWVAFAKDPQNGLREHGWPEYDPNAKTLVNLAFDNNITPKFTSPSEWDSHCEGSIYVP